MSFLKDLQASINYIEENLEGKFDVAEAAAIAYVSKYHYQRMFQLLLGSSVGEYVRKRKMTLAAIDLKNPNEKVIDIALKYGYQSPESFSKAFKRIHGLNPSEVSKKGVSLLAYPKITFQIQIKGVKEMNYKVIRKEAFEVIGISKEFSTSDGENFQEIPKMWSNFNNSKDCEKLFNNSGKLGLLGICLDFDPENETMTYMIGVENTGELKDDRFVIREINEFNYAVFDVFGKMPIAMQEASKRVYSEWFPSTNYKHAEGPEIEVYLPGDPTDDNYKSQIWIPIIKD